MKKVLIATLALTSLSVSAAKCKIITDGTPTIVHDLKWEMKSNFLSAKGRSTGDFGLREKERFPDTHLADPFGNTIKGYEVSYEVYQKGTMIHKTKFGNDFEKNKLCS